jgi:hypothetical protein
MKSKSFRTTKKLAFEACKKALHEFECEIVSFNFSSGIIESKKSGGLFSYGHEIRLTVGTSQAGKVNVSVSSNSIGIQIFD